LKRKTSACHITGFCELNRLAGFVLCHNAEIYVSKPKQGKSARKRQKSPKSTFLAFFQTMGKADEIRAILRGPLPYISHFISANKAQNQAS
jgi:hypothetical protein